MQKTSELVVDAAHHLGDRGAVRDHADRAHDLGARSPEQFV